VFANYADEAYPYKFRGEIHVARMAGGIPRNPSVAEGWLRTKIADRDDLIREMVATTMLELDVDAEEAARLVDENQHLNCFKRTSDDELYYEGRCLKSCLKEAGSIAVAAGKLPSRGWGKTNKGIKSFLAEHVFIVEDVLPLGVHEPAGIAQRFISTHHGTGIQYEEFVTDVSFEFMLITDQNLSERDWGMIWLTAEQEGIGAARSQGNGRFVLTRWEPVES
jgi:hypothetical protein